MNYTENLGLKLPEGSDNYNVQDFNDNMNILDSKIGVDKYTVPTIVETEEEIKLTLSDVNISEDMQLVRMKLNQEISRGQAGEIQTLEVASEHFYGGNVKVNKYGDMLTPIFTSTNGNYRYHLGFKLYDKNGSLKATIPYTSITSNYVSSSVSYGVFEDGNFIVGCYYTSQTGHYTTGTVYVCLIKRDGTVSVIDTITSVSGITIKIAGNYAITLSRPRSDAYTSSQPTLKTYTSTGTRVVNSAVFTSVYPLSIDCNSDGIISMIGAYCTSQSQAHSALLYRNC